MDDLKLPRLKELKKKTFFFGKNKHAHVKTVEIYIYMVGMFFLVIWVGCKWSEKNF